MKALFRIEGMTCGACLATITEALSATAGVVTNNVLLITEEALIEYDPSLVTTDKLIEVIEDCGFDATLIKSSEAPSSASSVSTVLQVRGMTCGACLATIKELLELIDGVESALVSLITEQAAVVHSQNIQPAQLVEAIEDCGFEANIESLTKQKQLDVVSRFQVTGMTCAACLTSITNALLQMDGVSLAAVSEITEEALVKHASHVLPDAIIDVIEGCGFDAVLSQSQTDDPQSSGDDTDDDVLFQIYGLTDEADANRIKNLVETYLSLTDGVLNYLFSFSGQNSLLSNQDEEVGSSGDVLDELSIHFNPQKVGVRHLVDNLDTLDDQGAVKFVIINLIDHLLESQLKILSRVKEIQYWKRNLVWSVALGVPVIILNWTHTLPPWNHLMLIRGLYWTLVLQCIPTLYIQFVLGKVFLTKFRKFVANGGKGALMDVLVCISTMVAYTFSIIAMIILVWHGQTLKPPKTLFETTCMLVMFISFGKWLENRAKGATLTALSKLLQLTPSNCTIVLDMEKYDAFMNESEKQVDSTEGFPTRIVGIDLIQAGDVAIVLPGSKISADGVIIYGETEVDESLITGESLPVHKRIGDSVIGGSVNGPGAIHVRVTHSSKRSQLQQIINLVKESQVNRAPVQRFADFVAARFVPLVITLAILTFVIWTVICLAIHKDRLPMAFNMEENGRYFVCLKLAISVVVVACPCALGLAAPTAIMVGTGVGAKNGVLIKGGDVFERVTKLNVLLFDKTGTLTTGVMRLVNFKQILTSAQLDVNKWWGVVGALELNSEHPVGKLISQGAKLHMGLSFEEDSFPWKVSNFQMYPGLGVYGKCSMGAELHEVYIGNLNLIKAKFPGSEFKVFDEEATTLKTMVNTTAHVLIDGEYAGFVELTDQLKPGAKKTIRYLQQVEGYQVGIVTGDLRGAALKIAKELGIPVSNVFSEVTPINKDKVITDLKSRLEDVSIGFIGDGINDAPALAQADVGMAISTGTDIAMESADIVLLGLRNSNNELVGIVNGLSISNATFNRVKWNFLWAALYNLIMLPFAMGCFLPFNLMLPPIAAAAAMAVSSISVVVNSLLLKNWKQPSLDYDELDEETHMGEVFDLKDGTNAEFQMVKRDRKLTQRLRNAMLRGMRDRNGGYRMINS
ncbi:heavy metal translocating P-type ATPase [Kocuria palustris]|nr:heavy metal translocating P-type ATPase [Kocuria palustris]